MYVYIYIYIIIYIYIYAYTHYFFFARLWMNLVLSEVTLGEDSRDEILALIAAFRRGRSESRF
jgi:hypothetical protein